MILRSLDSGDMEYVAGWLAEDDVRQWLDFGGDIPIVDAASVQTMAHQKSNLCQLFTSDVNDLPIGVVGLSHISDNFRSASLWYVLGEKEFCGCGYTSRAVSRLLTVGFRNLGFVALVRRPSSTISLPSDSYSGTTFASLVGYGKPTRLKVVRSTACSSIC